MFSTVKQIVRGQIKKFQSQRFRNMLLAVRQRDFSIISSNCIGGIFYQLLDLPYTTPTVGLFFFAPCFVKFISDLPAYLKEELIPADTSRYELGNWKRQTYGMYPLGKLGDIEIHFMHYANWDEAVQKWTRRVNRVNFDRLFFIFTDKDLCDDRMLETFDRLPWPKKVCFTASKYDLKSCVQIPAYSHRDEVGNLTADYHYFNHHFDFVRWFNEA